MSKKQFRMNLEEFKDYLGIYGTDLSRWPSDLKTVAEDELNSNIEFQTVYNEEKEFDDFLNLREVEAPSTGLEERIILSAKTAINHESKSIFSFLTEVFSAFQLPKPVYALTTIFVIGITLGLLLNISNSNSDKDLMTAELSFYEGEYYE